MAAHSCMLTSDPCVRAHRHDHALWVIAEPQQTVSACSGETYRFSGSRRGSGLSPLGDTKRSKTSRVVGFARGSKSLDK